MKFCSTNCQQIIDGVRKEFPYPITYDKKPTPKQKFNVKKLYDIDMLSFGSDIGHVTNCSTYWWSLLYNYDKDSIEYNEIIKRLKLMRMQQGSSIDKSKGIKVSPMPSYFTKYKKCNNDLDRELVVCKKPYFQKYVYPKLAMEYDKFFKARETYSLLKYKCKWEENQNEDFIKYMNIKNPVLDNNSIMNNICHHLENEVQEIKRNYKQQDIDVVTNILIDNSVLVNEYNLLLFEGLLKEYKTLVRNEKNIRKSQNGNNDYNKQKRYSMICHKIKSMANEITNNSIEIANLAVLVGYSGKQEENKDFVWNIFGKEVFENVKRNQEDKVFIPVKTSNDDNDFKYLGDNFKLEEIVEEEVNFDANV